MQAGFEFPACPGRNYKTPLRETYQDPNPFDLSTSQPNWNRADFVDQQAEAHVDGLVSMRTGTVLGGGAMGLLLHPAISRGKKRFLPEGGQDTQDTRQA